MKAVRFHQTGAPDVLQLEDIPIPTPGPDELLIRVEAAGVNYADTVRRWGDYYPVPTPLPFVAGSEVVGIVTALGANVPAGLLGKRVFGAPPAGGYGEYVAVAYNRVFLFPENLDPVQGVALFIQGLSAALILRQSAQLKPGATVFIEGAAGGVGCFGLQLARLYGAAQVIGAASSPAKRDKILGLGADVAVDYSAPGWSAAVMAHTQGRGVDVVMEMTGGEVFREAMQILAPRGRVVVYGIASRQPFQIPSEKLISRGHSVTGFYLGLFFDDRALIESILAELAQWVAEGKLKIDIGGVLPFAQAAQAHFQLEERNTTGKLVLVP